MTRLAFALAIPAVIYGAVKLHWPIEAQVLIACGVLAMYFAGDWRKGGVR